MAACLVWGGLAGTEFCHPAWVDRATLLFAAHQPELRAVVSLAAFAHPAAMMRRWLATLHIPYWPLGAYILAYVQHVIGFRFDAIAPRNTIARVAFPVLIVHGLADDTVPVTEAREIYAACASDAVELLLIPGSHDDYGDIGLQLAGVRDFQVDRVGALLPAPGEAQTMALKD